MVVKESTRSIVRSIPFQGSVKRSDGKVVRRKFKATVIGVKRQEGDPSLSPDEKSSNIQPQDDTSYAIKNIIPTPYNMKAMVALEEISNVMRECIDAMVTNIECFGWNWRPRKIDEKTIQDNKAAIELELIKLEFVFETLCPEESFIEIRKRLRRDLELTGNAYLEVIRNIDTGELLEFNHVPSHRIRLTKTDKTITPYDVSYIDPEDNYKVKTRKRRKRFRHFVQVDKNGKPIVWFTEYGDPRPTDMTDGLVEGSKSNNKVKEPISIENRATELVHIKLYSPRSPYGIPRWVGRWISVEGSRRSEEINYFTLSNNHVPSMFIMVQNGELTEGSVERLTEMIESQVAGDPNYSKAVILEAESGENEVFPGQVQGAKLTVKELGKTQQKEQMFQAFDDNNQLKVSRSFRLPSLLVGRSTDLTRATAQASIQFADQQVFHPERTTMDTVINRILRDAGVRWHTFRTRTPNITDNEVLVKAMLAAEKSGGMTPRRTDVLMQDIFEGTLGPMPQEINLDVPFTIQFAQAQNAMLLPGGGTGVERSDRTWVSNYVNTVLRGID